MIYRKEQHTHRTSAQNDPPWSPMGSLRTIPIGLRLVLVLSAAVLPMPSQAITISFTTVDLPDLVVGEDLRLYSYSVANAVFDTNFGFSIAFDPTLYAGLEDPPPSVNGDWDVLAFQPDPSLPASGLYDALALVDGASLADSFTVEFVWLGGAGLAPGPQAFTVNEFNEQGLFLGVVESGQTISVSEPGMLVSACLTLLAVASFRRRTGSHSRVSSEI